MKTAIHTLLRTAAAIGVALAVTACSTTRRIPDDEMLYTGVKSVSYLDASIPVPADVKSQVSEAVDVPPNNYLKMLHWRYPFPLGLWVYNNMDPDAHGLKGWLYRKLAAQPVLVSDVRPELRTKMIDHLMHDNGYLRASTSYQIEQGRNPKKAAIAYKVTAGHAFDIDSVVLLPDTSALAHRIDSLVRRDPYLGRPGAIYCVDSLSAARTRIANKLRNRGYYFFSPSYIEYLADSLINSGSIALKVDLARNAPDMALEPYTTGKITVHVDRRFGGGSPDTVALKRATLVQMMPSRLRRGLIDECLTLRPGRTFSVRDMNRTQTYLSRMGIFSSINIEPRPDTLADRRTLDVDIYCTLGSPLEASVEVNATSKSNSYIGPGIILGITNNNIFGGGEQFTVQAVGSYEWQTGSGSNRSIFNSYEAGLTASLAFPRLLAPKWIPRSRYQLNWTRFNLNADLLNRPHFFKMAQLNASMNYDWRYHRHVSNTFTPLKLTYTKLLKTTADFDQIMDENPGVAMSFRNQFIPQMIYSYTYDRMFGRNNNLNWTFSLQEAGNVFWGIYSLCGVKGEKRLFGIPLSQFVKGSTQLVYSRRVARGEHWLVSRLGLGAAHAYGNASQVPYAEQFYIGGANSVRAFTVRSIGPGSYRPPQDSPQAYFDQTGTFKLEANVEYRFPIVSVLHGAVFMDAGNVWLLRNDPLRPGGQLRASSFLRDIALGTGVGLRVDIQMLVIRGDLGIGIHAPYDTGRTGYYNMTSFKNSLAFHLAIGYPF